MAAHGSSVLIPDRIFLSEFAIQSQGAGGVNTSGKACAEIDPAAGIQVLFLGDACLPDCVAGVIIVM